MTGEESEALRLAQRIAAGAELIAADAAAIADDDLDDPFTELAAEVIGTGEPYGGVSLRYTAKGIRVACQECGELPSPDLMGWSSDWLTLCQDARRHALGEGHQVAVSLWLGAIYGPVAESAGGGNETGRDQAPQAAEEAPAAPGEV